MNLTKNIYRRIYNLTCYFIINLKKERGETMSGFDMDKFENLLHFIIDECGYKPNVGKTVLFKLLYFSDFDFYEIYETKLTGESYRKIENGPAPIDFDKAKNVLIREGKIEEIDHQIPFTPFRYNSLKSPDISSFNKEEIEVILDVINRYSDMRAGEISQFSHQDVPYIVTKCKDIIDYDFVFYRYKKHSVREYDAE